MERNVSSSDEKCRKINRFFKRVATIQRLKRLRAYLIGKCNQFFKKLDPFLKKIIPILKSDVKDVACREMFLSQLDDEKTTIDSKYCVITLLLHALLQPQRLNKTTKPTIADGQADFIPLVTTPNDVQPKLSQLKEEYAAKKETFQPKIIVVGSDYANISEYFIYCDGIKWRCSTYMKCMEYIIKLSYVFKIHYSHNSKQVWAFMEQFFFSNLISKLDSD